MPTPPTTQRRAPAKTGKTLILIEAPGKLSKLRQILGSDYLIKASGGHIRELATDGADALGFDLVGNQVQCRWTARDAKAKATIADLKKAAKEAATVILATDEDREGESISWHLADVLNLKNPQRATYREITPAAVRAAIAHPRPLDRSLVAAGICRAVLDKLVGYRGSPLVWQLRNGAKSIGRVQTAALHILCQRERQIQTFVPEDYWSVFVDYAEGFRAFYKGSGANGSGADGATVDEAAAPIDDAAAKGQPLAPESDRVRSQAAADRLVAIARQLPHQVIQVEGKTATRTPPPPFTTSSLQQAIGAKLKLSPERTMQLAQKLYEQGHITYHRTDSVFLSETFQTEARDWLTQHDPTNLPAKATRHRSAKSAQEAHEAIRPTHIHRSSELLRAELEPDAFQLYVLIWKRTIAALCQPARLRQTKILTQSGEVRWLARGQVLEFAGYTRYWNNLSSDTELPNVTPGQPLQLQQADSEPKQTQPPPRFTEPKLVQQMERSGIGRPSTYAPTVATLKQRHYVDVIKGQLQPTGLGLEVDSFMEKALPKLVDTAFTAEMEQALDQVADGKLDWQTWLTDWNREYFDPALQQARQIIPVMLSDGSLTIAPTPTTAAKAAKQSKVSCSHCQQPMVEIRSQKVSKGYFLKCQTCGDSVLFWSDRAQQWQPPRPKSDPANVAKLTEFACPICGKPLEEYAYTKAGQAKIMLRCSDPVARQKKPHQEAVYFQAATGFWSPKFGEVQTASASKKTAKTRTELTTD